MRVVAKAAFSRLGRTLVHGRRYFATGMGVRSENRAVLRCCPYKYRREFLQPAWIEWVAAHLDRRLVLALAQIDDMPEQTVRRPLGIADLDHHFGPNPLHPRQHQR